MEAFVVDLRYYELVFNHCPTDPEKDSLIAEQNYGKCFESL